MKALLLVKNPVFSYVKNSTNEAGSELQVQEASHGQNQR